MAVAVGDESKYAHTTLLMTEQRNGSTQAWLWKQYIYQGLRGVWHGLPRGTWMPQRHLHHSGAHHSMGDHAEGFIPVASRTACGWLDLVTLSLPHSLSGYFLLLKSRSEPYEPCNFLSF